MITEPKPAQATIPVVALDDPVALHQPRAVVARVQRSRARGGARREQSAARAPEVRRDLRDEPRRVLHDSGRRDQAADRGAGRAPLGRRPPADRAPRGDLANAARVAAAADARAQRRAAAGARARGHSVDARGRARRGDAGRARRHVRRDRLSGADAAGGRQRTSVPVHLEPLALAGGRARGGDARRRRAALRAREDSADATALRSGRRRRRKASAASSCSRT